MWAYQRVDRSQAPYIEGFESLGVHALGVVDLVAVIVVVVIVVVVVNHLSPTRGQILGAHAQLGLHRVIAPGAVKRGLKNKQLYYRLCRLAEKDEVKFPFSPYCRTLFWSGTSCRRLRRTSSVASSPPAAVCRSDWPAADPQRWTRARWCWSPGGRSTRSLSPPRKGPRHLGGSRPRPAPQGRSGPGARWRCRSPRRRHLAERGKRRKVLRDLFCILVGLFTTKGRISLCDYRGEVGAFCLMLCFLKTSREVGIGVNCQDKWKLGKKGGIFWVLTTKRERDEDEEGLVGEGSLHFLVSANYSFSTHELFLHVSHAQPQSLYISMFFYSGA